MSTNFNVNPFNGTTRWIWSKEGIAAPRPDAGRFRIRHFRRGFDAPAGAALVVHVSADSRYRLWCNGHEVAFGPAKGDVEHHFYETADLAPHLQPGQNVLAAKVEYYGDSWSETPGGGPGSRMTAKPGFVLFGIVKDSTGTELINVHSDKQWRVMIDESLTYQDCEGHTNWLGGMERLDCATFPWGFQQIGFDDSSWPAATETTPAVPEGWNMWAVSPHRLIPRMIAPLEVGASQWFAKVMRSPTGDDLAAWSSLIAGRGSMTIPAGQKTIVILDAGAETTAYPRLVFSGGAGANIKLRYAEALFSNGHTKANRNDPNGELRGYFDEIIADGARRTYEPFFFRTFRFVAVEIQTAGDPVTIESLDYRFCGYPFQQLATFDSSEPKHAGIWEISWRTARLCAHETYEDCPYYEQLQYGGDTQVQAMISHYVPGDASLARQFLFQYDWSRTSDGLTRSRYPARVPQTIPFWSLHWVMSIHDYWMQTGDLAAVKELLPGALATLDYFDRRVSADGIVGTLTGWLCADWCPQWTKQVDGNGVPPGTLAGQSAFVSLITAVTIDQAIPLMVAAGRNPAELKKRSASLKQNVHRLFHDADRGLYRDTPAGAIASAYTNVWAILADMPVDHKALAEKIVNDKSLCQLTMFSAYFAYRALAKAGRYDLAPMLLAPWHSMIDWGLTTCPEIPDYSRTRSDCHAWSAGPLVEFLREMLGVYPIDPGYATIGIAPKPAGLTWAKGRVPLTRRDGSEPAQFVTVDWRIAKGKFHLKAEVPAGRPVRIQLPAGRPRNFPNGGAIQMSVKLPPAL